MGGVGPAGSETLFEFRVSRDENLLNGDQLARVQYRRPGQRRWSRFVVVLDDETTYESVEANVEAVIAAYEGSQSRVG